MSVTVNPCSLAWFPKVQFPQDLHSKDCTPNGPPLVCNLDLHTPACTPPHAQQRGRQRPRPKPRNPQVGAVQLDALTNLFGANCQWETSARTAVDKTGCWGEQIPLHEGGGQWGANVLMCGRWLGRDNGRISQSPGWLIWDGSSQPLTVGSPIVPLLIPTSHKLQTKVNLFLKGGGEYRPVFQLGKVTQKLICKRWLTL